MCRAVWVRVSRRDWSGREMPMGTGWRMCCAICAWSAHTKLGISNGGWLILKLAGVAPELISSAVLISSAGFVRPRWQLIFNMLPVLLFTRPERRGARFLQVMGAPGIAPAQQDFGDSLCLALSG